MRILIATSQVPFIRGGAEVHAEGLRDALRRLGHEAEIVGIPFKPYPAEAIVDQMLACSLLDVTEVAGSPVDLLIGLRFPAYLIAHPRKVLWILHQYRAAYEFWDHAFGRMIHAPSGRCIRDFIREVDGRMIAAAQRVFANSQNVASRLERYCAVRAAPLYHPPLNAALYFLADSEDYFFFPSRLCPPKRHSLVLEALGKVRTPARVRIVGNPDYPAYRCELERLAETIGVSHRIDWMGYVTEEQKISLYAHCLGVIYPPIDEDYGYVTLEAMLASKPVIVCTDSGGPLEFVSDRQTGLVVEPSPEALAEAMDFLWTERKCAAQWGRAGREKYIAANITWESVVDRLTT